MRRINFFRRIVLFLVRKKLRVKIYEDFYFNNQKNKDDRYFFKKDGLYHVDTKALSVVPSNVSLMWLLDEDCHITIENSGSWLTLFLNNLLCVDDLHFADLHI